jgi:hypothetical protein
MAFQLDSNIPLMGRGINVVGSVTSGLQARGMLDQLQQAKEAAPLRQQLLQDQAAQSQLLTQQTQQQQQIADQDRVIGSIANSYSGVKSLVDAGKFNEAADALEANKEVLRQSGVTNFEDSDAAIAAFRSNDPKEINRFKMLGEQAIKLAGERGIGKKAMTTEEQTFESLTTGFTPEEKEQARRVRAGLSPRAVGSSSQTIAETGKTEQVAESEAAIASKKAAAVEAAKLSAQLKLKPEVEAAVRTAVNNAVSAGEQLGTEKSNTKALAIYEAGISGLIDGLSDTETGPVVGLLPAMTSNQQIADGAIAVMAPILKQLFRESGEGSFSDGDQKLLIDMIPSRKDTPEARRSKISNIDTIVRAKLGASAGQSAQQDTGITEDEFRRMSPEQRAEVIRQLQQGK